MYLGHIIDKNGLHTCNSIVESIKGVPVTDNCCKLNVFGIGKLLQ